MTIHYLDVDGAPAVYDDTFTEMPRKLINGRWKTLYDYRSMLMDSVTITKERFDEMVAQQETEGGQP